MVKTEIVTLKDFQIEYSYSDKGYYLQNKDTGAIYAEVYNPIGSGREYIEVESAEEATEFDYIRMLRLMGVSV